MASSDEAWDELVGLFPEFERPERWLPRLRRHALLVAEEAAAGRMTAVTGTAVVRRHYAECLEQWRIARQHASRRVVVDVGSGAGFPGLVVAAVESGAAVHLVEPLRKRAGFLERAASALALTNVTVHAQRAEEAGRGPLRGLADIVTARAVAPLPELLEYTAPLARVGGLLALAKGSGAAAEVEAARQAADALGLGAMQVVHMRPAVSQVISVVLGRKVADTPQRYPRRPGVPGKRQI